MANESPEQDLIDSFINILSNHKNNDLKIQILHNKSCRSKKYADIEFTSVSGIKWAIEAKSNDSKDAHNTVHKIFGELLKETGRQTTKNTNIAVLLPESSIDFYSRLFQSIHREKFIQFGKMIPIECIFTFGVSNLKQISWEDFYDSYKPCKL